MRSAMMMMPITDGQTRAPERERQNEGGRILPSWIQRPLANIDAGFHLLPLASPWWWSAALLITTAILALGVRERWAPELAALLAPYLSHDGIVTAAGVERLRQLLQRFAVMSALGAAASIVAARPARRARLVRSLVADPLAPGAVPIRMLVWTILVSLCVSALWRMRDFALVEWLLRKEGPLETLTAMLLLAAAALCALSARHWVRRDAFMGRGMVAPALAVVAIGAFLMAMEEISWGQHLLGFATPESWARINYQQETTLHNLVDQPTLDRSWHALSLGFASGVCLMWLVLAHTSRPWLRVLLPHPSLVPLAIMVGITGTLLHAEVAEFLIALFAICYAFRAYRLAAAQWATLPGRARGPHDRDNHGEKV